jgi:hypothetical protein
VEDVVTLIILGTVLGIGAMALLAWTGAILLHRVFGPLQDAVSEPEEHRGSLLGSWGRGKHRPGGSRDRIAA